MLSMSKAGSAQRREETNRRSCDGQILEWGHVTTQRSIAYADDVLSIIGSPPIDCVSAEKLHRQFLK